MWELHANKLTIWELLKTYTCAAPSHVSSAKGPPTQKRARVWRVTNVASALPALAAARRVSSVFDSYTMTHFRSKGDDLWRNTRRFVEAKDAFRPLVVNTRRNTFLFQRSLTNSLCLQPDVAIRYRVCRRFGPIINWFVTNATSKTHIFHTLSSLRALFLPEFLCLQFSICGKNYRAAN